MLGLKTLNPIGSNCRPTKAVDYNIVFAPKRERVEDDDEAEAAKQADDNEFGVEPKAKKSKVKKQIIVSGGLCGFKVRP